MMLLVDALRIFVDAVIAVIVWRRAAVVYVFCLQSTQDIMQCTNLLIGDMSSP